MIFAILQAQWRSMRSFRVGGSSGGALISVAIGLFWYGFWTVIAAAAAQIAASPDFRQYAPGVVPPALAGVFVYWQLAPMVSASLGASLDMRKLLVYPIPAWRLFAVEVLLRIATALEMLIVLAGGVIGLLRNHDYGGWTGAPRILAAAVLFTAFNVLLSAGIRNLLERLLSNRRTREVLVLALVLLTALPRLLITFGVSAKRFEPVWALLRRAVWPWTAAVSIALAEHVAAATAILGLWIAAAFYFGRRQFDRNLRFDAEAAEATEVDANKDLGWSDRLFRLPGRLLPDPVAALVEKELRSLARTPRFRTVFIMGFSFGIMVWLPLVMGRRAAQTGAVGENFLVFVSIYALTLLGQVSYWNAFGFDRSAAQLYFYTPVGLGRALVAKNVAAAIYILLEISAVIAACLLLRVKLPPGKVLEALVVTPIAALYMLGIGNMSSVYYPRPMSPERVSQGGTASRMQALIFVFYPIALLPVLLAYLARYAFDSQAAFDLVLAFAALLGVLVYWIALESSVAAARLRREVLLGALSRGEGPVIAE